MPTKKIPAEHMPMAAIHPDETHHKLSIITFCCDRIGHNMDVTKLKRAKRKSKEE